MGWPKGRSLSKAHRQRISRAKTGAPRLWTGRRAGIKGGTVGPNRMLSRLRHMFNWAIERGYLDAHPFKRHGRTVIRLDSDVEQIRTRLRGDN